LGRGRRNAILAGYVVYAIVYAGFGLVRSTSLAWALFALYGVHNALTQGVQRAFAADLTCAGARGTGLGAYHTFTGVALLPASLIAGFLWQTIGPAAPFYFGSAIAAISAILLAVFFRRGAICSAT
jgi:MFS family permease